MPDLLSFWLHIPTLSSKYDPHQFYFECPLLPAQCQLRVLALTNQTLRWAGCLVLAKADPIKGQQLPRTFLVLPCRVVCFSQYTRNPLSGSHVFPWPGAGGMTISLPCPLPQVAPHPR